MNDNDSELRDLAKRLTPQEMRDLAVELERRARVMRGFASCVEFAGEQILFQHLRWSLNQDASEEDQA